MHVFEDDVEIGKRDDTEDLLTVLGGCPRELSSTTSVTRNQNRG